MTTEVAPSYAIRCPRCSWREMYAGPLEADAGWGEHYLAEHAQQRLPLWFPIGVAP